MAGRAGHRRKHDAALTIRRGPAGLHAPVQRGEDGGLDRPLVRTPALPEHRRRGFKNDLIALNDETPHDERYDRAVEYTLAHATLGSRTLGIAKAALTRERTDRSPGTVAAVETPGAIAVAARDGWVAVHRGLTAAMSSLQKSAHRVTAYAMAKGPRSRCLTGEAVMPISPLEVVEVDGCANLFRALAREGIQSPTRRIGVTKKRIELPRWEVGNEDPDPRSSEERFEILPLFPASASRRAYDEITRAGAHRGRVVRSAADFERPDPFRVEAAAATQVVVGDGVLRVVRDVESIPPKAMTLKIIQDGLEFLRPPGNSEMKRRKDRDHGEGGKHECTSSGRSAA